VLGVLPALAGFAAPVSSAGAAQGAGLPAVQSGPYGLLASNANFIPGKTPAQRTADYRRLYDAGVRAIRLDINWGQVEPVGAHGQYDFSERDQEVQNIRAAGLKVIGILGYGHPDYSSVGGAVGQTPLSGGIPPFAVGSAYLWPPDKPDGFANYAEATARHFAGDAIAWEVWNEENEGWRFWPPHENPAAYDQLLCATYPRVKAADPSATVLFGGVFFPAAADLPGTSGPDFVQQAYQANPGVRGCFDAMAYHPYPYPFTAPDLDVPIRGSVYSAADAMRAVLQANDDGAKPLWITEVGWPTHSTTYGVTEEKQAQYLARTAAVTFAQGLPVLTWYTYGDDTDPTGGANQEAWFGLFRADDSPKPASRALGTFSAVFADTHFSADLSRSLGLPPGQQNVGGRGFALQYSRPGARVTALWLADESAAEAQGHMPAGGSFSPGSLPVSLPVASPTVTVYGYLGDQREVGAHEGRVQLQIGPGPVYVQDGAPPSSGPLAAAGAGASTGPCRGACAAKAIALLATRLRCGRRPSVVIRLRRRPGVHVRSVTVYVNGRRTRQLRATRRGHAQPLPSRLTVPVPSGGSVRVRVVVRGRRRGRTLTLTTRRAYRPCARPLPGHRKRAPRRARRHRVAHKRPPRRPR